MSRDTSGSVVYTDVLAAQRRLAGVAVRTPVLRSAKLDADVGRSVWMKAEQQQLTGSFKFRGAYNAAVAVDPAGGFCTVSSGNHGYALATCGQLLGAHVVVHMPEDAPAVKTESVRRAGAEVVSFDRYRVPQASVAALLIREGPGRYVSAHDDRRVIAGAATAALELIEDVPELDAVLVPVGGGGCLAGSGIVCRERLPRCQVIGVEPEASGVNRRSLDAGRPVSISVPRTIADGQTLTAPGALTFAVMQQVVDDVLLVSEAEIVAAMIYLERWCGIVTEPSGASALAAVLAGRLPTAVRGGRIGVVLTGGNRATPRPVTGSRSAGS